MLCDYCARREPESLMFRALAGAARTESVDQVQRASMLSRGCQRRWNEKLRSISDAGRLRCIQHDAKTDCRGCSTTRDGLQSDLRPFSPLSESGEFGLVVSEPDFEKTKDFLTSDLDRRKC